MLAHAVSLTGLRNCKSIVKKMYHTWCQDCVVAISQVREIFKGVASLEATDSLYSQDCIMLTCAPVADSATADSADTWRVITLRISSSYPKELPSVVVRMSRDAQLAPQVTNSVSGLSDYGTVSNKMLAVCVSTGAQPAAQFTKSVSKSLLGVTAQILRSYQ